MTNPTTPDPIATDDPPKFIVRPAAADALPYVLSQWGHGTERIEYAGEPQQGFLRKFAPIQARIIKRSKVLTAMHGERIAGFVIYEPRIDIDHTLHWIHTRTEYRQQGVAKLLLAAAQLGNATVSSWTSALRYIGLADAKHERFWLSL